MIARNKGQTVTWSRGHVMDRFRRDETPRRTASRIQPRPAAQPTSGPTDDTHQSASPTETTARLTAAFPRLGQNPRPLLPPDDFLSPREAPADIPRRTRPGGILIAPPVVDDKLPISKNRAATVQRARPFSVRVGKRSEQLFSRTETGVQRLGDD